jgi:hypothetical protein
MNILRMADYIAVSHPPRDPLECSECGTTNMRVPDPVSANDQIFCNLCSGYIGRWYEVERQLRGQASCEAVYYIADGRIIRLEAQLVHGILRTC